NLFRVPSTELRDRRLLTLASAPIDQIQVRVEGKEPFTVAKQASNAWQVIEPSSFPADPELMQAFLSGLADLEILKFVKDVVTDFSPYGLTRPARTYSLFQKSPGNPATNPLVAQVDFGTPLRDTIYARRADEDSVYEVSGAQYEILPDAPYRLRD